MKQTKIYKEVNNYKNKINEKFNYELKNNEVYHNASYKLKLISAYGDNEAYHPKVLNFKEKWKKLRKSPKIGGKRAKTIPK